MVAPVPAIKLILGTQKILNVIFFYVQLDDLWISDVPFPDMDEPAAFLNNVCGPDLGSTIVERYNPIHSDSHSLAVYLQ